jgi:hypothetical protein
MNMWRGLLDVFESAIASKIGDEDKDRRRNSVEREDEFCS